MPNDNQKSETINKPITPALSSRFRNAGGGGAPRLAGTSRPSPTTTGRKDTPEKTFSPSTEPVQAQSLNGNVTPRSGARATRISTESPNTPALKRRLSADGSVTGTSSSVRQANARSTPGSEVQGYSRPTIKSSASDISLTRKASNSSTTSKKDDEPTKFVRANGARSTTAAQSPKSTQSPRPPTSSFLKAGSPRILNSVPTSTFRNTQPNQKEDRFVRANDAQTRPSVSPVVARKHSTASLTTINSARVRSPELLRTQSYPFPRAQSANLVSPGKTSTMIMTASKPSSPLKQSPSQSSPTIVSPSSPSDRRRSFGNNISNSLPARPMLHKKSASVSNFGPPPRYTTSPILNTTHHVESQWITPSVALAAQHTSFATSSPETLSPRSTSLASSKTMGTSVTSDTDISEISKTGLPLAHINHVDPPIQPSILQQLGSTPLAQAQMQAANARRERKVLDLEISNSSLLAINKTLEKELRKQSSELRRFRRLSRTGRLSFAPSNRSVSGQSAMSLDTLQELSEDDAGYTDEDEESESDELEDEVDGQFGDVPDGPTARERRRARDEKRLMLDLSKHQQLLMDSQKLSQSIRKCLSISEELIKEGNQALVYKVGIGDLKLGGRVLSAEDSDAVDHHVEPDFSRRGLLSPSMTQMELEEAALWLSQYHVSGEAIDRYMHEPPDPG